MGLKELCLKSDGYTEFIYNNKEFTLDCFNDNLVENLFENKEKFILYGRKGSGKTFTVVKYLTKKNEKKEYRFIDLSKTIDLFNQIFDSHKNEINVTERFLWEMYIYLHIALLLIDVYQEKEQKLNFVERMKRYRNLRKIKREILNSGFILNRASRNISGLKVQEITFSMPSKFFSINGEIKKTKKIETTFLSLRSNLLDFINNYCMNSGIKYLVFDSVNTIYSEKKLHTYALNYIVQILKETNDSFFQLSKKEEKSAPLKSILILDEEIFNQTLGSDLLKYKYDVSLEIKWDAEKTKEFAEKILNTYDIHVKVDGENVGDGIDVKVDNENVGYGYDIIKDIVSYTFYRPRDIIEIFGLIKKIKEDTKTEHNEINYSEERLAINLYCSNYLLEDIYEELVIFSDEFIARQILYTFANLLNRTQFSLNDEDIFGNIIFDNEDFLEFFNSDEIVLHIEKEDKYNNFNLLVNDIFNFLIQKNYIMLVVKNVVDYELKEDIIKSSDLQQGKKIVFNNDNVKNYMYNNSEYIFHLSIIRAYKHIGLRNKFEEMAYKNDEVKT